MIDLVFYLLCFAYACTIGLVLYRFRAEPLYDPRILFSLAASLWLLIIHGYVIDFEGYLAAKPGFYTEDIHTLSVIAIGLMLLGYIAFIAGASLGVRLSLPVAQRALVNDRLLVWICVGLIGVASLNFAANVVLISGGNLLEYLASIALRSYQVDDAQGISASGYLLGFIGVQVIAYIVGRKAPSRTAFFGLVLAVLTVLVIRYSQGRIFQTLVLLGACYVAYAMGAAWRRRGHVAWIWHAPYLLAAGVLGVGIYFVRLASALRHLGTDVSWDSLTMFGSRFVHFALERGNVPNFPVVFTIIDKMPAEVGWLYGKTLFNWAIYFVPRSILQSDYLISIWVKNTWYLDIEGGGLPPTCVGEWYANFGTAGVIAGMFVVGLGLGAIFKMAMRSGSAYLAVLWANLAFGFVVIYPKTDLAQIPVFSIFVILCLWLLMVLLRSGVPRNEG